MRKISIQVAALISAFIAQFALNIWALLIAPWYGKIFALMALGVYIWLVLFALWSDKRK